MASAFISLTTSAGAILINPDQIRGYAEEGSAAARLLGATRTPVSVDAANAVIALIDVPTPFYVTQTPAQITTAIAAVLTASDGAAVGANNTFTGDNTFSGTNIFSGATTISGVATFSSRVVTSGTIIQGSEVVATAGADQSGATTMTSNIPLKLVTGHGTQGVKLPAYHATTSPVGAQLLIANTHDTNTVILFPNTGEEIDNAGANTSITVATNQVKTLTRISSTNWSTNT